MIPSIFYIGADQTQKIGLKFTSIQWILTFIGLAILFFFLYFIIFRFQDVSLSFRNVMRNKRRSLITLTAVIVAFAGNSLLGIYFLDMFRGSRESAIRSQTGHLQIFKDGFETYGKSAPEDYIITNYDEIIQTIQKDSVLDNDVNLYMKELLFNGIITSLQTDRSLTYLGRGVDAKQDGILSSYDSYVIGTSLKEQEPNAIVLGEGLATQLGVTENDVLTLLGSTYDGGLNVLDARVQGAIKTFAKDYGNVIVKSNLAYAQQMLALDGINKIVILLDDTKHTQRAKLRLASIVAAHPEWGVKVRDWLELADVYPQIYTMMTSIYLVVSSLLFALVVFLVSNTMSMSIYERFSEFGTLRSIGLHKTHLVSLVFLEGIILSVLGILIGFFATWLLGYLITAANIMLPPPPGSSVGYPLYLRMLFYQKPYVEMNTVNAFGIIAVTALSTVFPAVHAIRLKIIDALRHN